MNTHTKVTTQQVLSRLDGAPVPSRNGKPPTLVSKVEKYDWPMLNKPGEFTWIAKNELHIAPEYQRKAKESSYMRIAREWDWIACGVLVVSERDGKWWVIDGQHRKLAADRRSDISQLPCMVFQGCNLGSEATNFLAVNTHRFAVNSLTKFNASVTAGDSTAIFVRDTLQRSGLSAGSTGSKTTVACIATIHAVATEDRARFLRLWPLITHMHTDSEIFGDVVKGLWLVEKMWEASGGGKSLVKDPHFAKLIRIGGKACNQEIKRMSIERGKGGMAVFRDSILSALRKKI